MIVFWLRLIAFCIGLLFSLNAFAALTMTEAEEVAQTFRTNILQAFNMQSASELASNFDPNAILILSNAQVIYTRANIQIFMEAPYTEGLFQISDVSIHSLDIDPKVFILDDDSFLATGTMVCDIEFNTTERIALPHRWTSVIRRQEGKWSIVSYQATVDVFENAFINRIKQLYYLFSIVMFFLGISFTLLWKFFQKKREE